MTEVKLEPGWLTRDVTQAAQQANVWSNQKAQSGQRADQPSRPHQATQDTANQGRKE